MAQKERKCIACGRLLTGRKRKWCGHPDCGGWAAVHPPVTEVCKSCGTSFETYVGSGKVKCPRCEHRAAALRQPLVLPASEIEELLADYIRKDEAMAYVQNCIKLGPEKEQSTETMTFNGTNSEPITINLEFSTLFYGRYNPNYCDTCKKVTDHGQYGHCLSCDKKNPNAIVVCYCTNCSDYTLNDSSGICLRCNKRNSHYLLGRPTAVSVINKRLSQYEKWTGKSNWRYDAMTYWLLAWQKMYEMVIDGQPVSDIAQEFNMKENTVKARVREYCKEHRLDSPWKRKKK